MRNLALSLICCLLFLVDPALAEEEAANILTPQSLEIDADSLTAIVRRIGNSTGGRMGVLHQRSNHPYREVGVKWEYGRTTRGGRYWINTSGELHAQLRVVLKLKVPKKLQRSDAEFPPFEVTVDMTPDHSVVRSSHAGERALENGLPIVFPVNRERRRHCLGIGKTDFLLVSPEHRDWDFRVLVLCPRSKFVDAYGRPKKYYEDSSYRVENVLFQARAAAKGFSEVNQGATAASVRLSFLPRQNLPEIIERLEKQREIEFLLEHPKSFSSLRKWHNAPLPFEPENGASYGVGVEVDYQHTSGAARRVARHVTALVREVEVIQALDIRKEDFKPPEPIKGGICYALIFRSEFIDRASK